MAGRPSNRLSCPTPRLPQSFVLIETGLSEAVPIESVSEPERLPVLDGHDRLPDVTGMDIRDSSLPGEVAGLHKPEFLKRAAKLTVV